MLKDYFAEHDKSIYAVSRECGIPYSTLNDFVNGKVRVSQCKAGMLHEMSRSLGLTMDELYQMAEKGDEEACETDIMTTYSIPVSVTVRHKSYQARFVYEGESVTLELCKVSSLSRFYIKEIARWRAEEYIRNRRMKDFRSDT